MKTILVHTALILAILALIVPAATSVALALSYLHEQVTTHWTKAVRL